jgi:hypothetical protein
MKQCFSGTPCISKEQSSDKDQSPEAKPTGGRDSDSSENVDLGNTETKVDEVTSKFFCGASWEELVENCDTAKPCPSGSNAECEGGHFCFANTPCGATDASPVNEGGTSLGIFDFASMVEEIPPYCNGDAMSRNVGYWQSWSI